ncbi:tight adherence pilus pseudopilin TadF [Vibrio lentus]|nr:tight adherence pilus pseudopilin TadF [Vibrio lentus]
MLNTPVDNVAIKIESLTNKVNVAEFSTSKYRKLNCQTDSTLEHADLAPVEKRRCVHPLYRISLCEEQSSWFKPFFAGTSTTVKIGSSSTATVEIMK